VPRSRLASPACFRLLSTHVDRGDSHQHFRKRSFTPASNLGSGLNAVVGPRHESGPPATALSGARVRSASRPASDTITRNTTDLAARRACSALREALVREFRPMVSTIRRSAQSSPTSPARVDQPWSAGTTADQQTQLWPPSTGRHTPVMNAASSEARKTAAFATSQAVPMRPIGTASFRAATIASTESYWLEICL
jgi:hypothetical protein